MKFFMKNHKTYSTSSIHSRLWMQ